MRTKLSAVVVALAVVVLGAGSASATGWHHWPGKDRPQQEDCYGTSSHMTVKGDDGRITSWTWQDDADGGRWVEDDVVVAQTWSGHGWDKGWDKSDKDKKHKTWPDKDTKHKDKKDKKKDKKGKGWKDKDKGGKDGDHPYPPYPPVDDCTEQPEPEQPETPDVPDEGDDETPDTPDTPDVPEEEESGELDSEVTTEVPGPATPGSAPAATPVVAEPTFAG